MEFEIIKMAISGSPWQFLILTLPFLSTLSGSAGVFFLREKVSGKVTSVINAAASGLMLSSALFGLLAPALNTDDIYSKIQALCGFLSGYVILLVCKKGIASIERESISVPSLCILIHNIPEGIAVGTVFLGYLEGNEITFTSALSLIIGISLQNIPEGAIISIPEHMGGKSKGKSFVLGVLSGAVEPIFSLLSLVLGVFILKFYAVTLGFASGCMVYAVINELIPEYESMNDNCKGLSSLSFLSGFTVMLLFEIAF